MAAIVVYGRRGKALLPAMIHGDKLIERAAPETADGAGMRLLALAVAAACAAGAVWVHRLAG